jgi:ubiquinone/menaquinone biosynthesis C-methylase UbiE
MKIKRFNIFESSAIWDDFIDKINKGILPKDEPDVVTIDNLCSFIPIGSKILDISIGDGVYSEYFIENGFDVYGTDISDLAIDTMKKKYPDYTWIVHDTLEKFPFSDKYFNLVFARLSLHYFKKEDIENILLDISRILKDNGYLYIMVKISNTGNITTGKNSYSVEDWIDLLSNHFNIIEKNEEIKKAYSFEKEKSYIFEVIGKKI